jgi:hypothetical protein
MDTAREDFVGKRFLMLHTFSFLGTQDILTLATANITLQQMIYDNCQMGIMRDGKVSAKREVRVVLDREINDVSNVMCRMVDVYHVKLKFQDTVAVDRLLLFAKRLWAKVLNHREARPVVVVDWDPNALTMTNGEFG